MAKPFQPFIDELTERLKGELPAHQAHQKVMSHRSSIDQLGEQVKLAKQSAVLIFLYPHFDELHTVFIQRANYKGVHSGQIAFPGGRYELGDKILQNTALREAEEEVGVKAAEVQTLGSTSPLYVPPSNFLISPYVGFREKRPQFVAEPSEVAAIIESPLKALMGEHRLRDHKVKLADGQRMKVKGFPLQDKIIWGATAMILKEFTELVEELKSPISLK
jgi:8-oxo-dGTP pyrophosphatase MutT (NUDIX family)